MPNHTDIADPGSVDSIVRQILETKPSINQSSFSLSEFEIPKEHEIQLITIKTPNYNSRSFYAKNIEEEINSIMPKLTSQGVPHNFKFALYEAILNAYEHGNKKDPNKNIIVSFDTSKSMAEITVTDEGDEIKTSFLSYILFKRQNPEQPYINFYDFSKEEKSRHNYGLGTNLIHTYSDNVQYFKSKKGGLTVFMSRKKTNHDNKTNN